MNRKQLYYETVRNGLVPVERPHALPREADCLPVKWCATVTEDTLGYRKGERICGHARHFVHKRGYHNGWLYVREANLPKLARRFEA